MRSLLLLAGAHALVGPQRRTATLGLGCFWEPSEKLLAVDGVRDTWGAASSTRVGAAHVRRSTMIPRRCGYAGAEFPDAKPDYYSVCGGDGNVEAVRVDFDENVVSYEDVLDAAFEASKPVLGSRQYQSCVEMMPRGGSRGATPSREHVSSNFG